MTGNERPRCQRDGVCDDDPRCFECKPGLTPLLERLYGQIEGLPERYACEFECEAMLQTMDALETALQEQVIKPIEIAASVLRNELSMEDIWADHVREALGRVESALLYLARPSACRF